VAALRRNQWPPCVGIGGRLRAEYALLSRSGAFRSLPPERQREVASNTVAVASAMAEAEGTTVREVDFPGFVRDLVHGTFDAIVDASIRQMEAYAELVAAVAQSVDRFLEENVSDDDARVWLDRTLPGIDGAGEATATLAPDAARRSIAKTRQQLLATMVLMGVNRACE
jgi:hypothetical protein